MNVDFNLDILAKLLAQNTDKALSIDERFPKINEWRQKKKKPTFDQLVRLANYFNVPFGYFFLADIPEKTYPIPHYRTSDSSPFKPSDNLVETIQILEERQEWARDILIDFGNDPLTFAGSISTKTEVHTAAQKIREILKLPIDWANSEKTINWTDAFRLLVNRTEEAGIFVVINGVVGMDNNRALDIKEFRGFVLYDAYAPFIFINGKDFISGKIFTIIHEIAHVLTGKSASFDFRQLLPANNTLEQYCNAVAAEFLVPEKLLLSEFNKYGSDYDRLSRFFKVSRIVIARRLLDTAKIDQQDFLRAYQSFGKAEIKTSQSKGGNFYNSAPYKISRSFFNLLYSSTKQNKVLYRDAFRITGLSPKSFDGYVKEHIDTKK